MVIIAVAAVPLALAAVPAAPAAAAPPQIVIGVQADLSSATPPGHADIGAQQLNAVTLAAIQVNAAGGLSVGGVLYEVKVISADGKCSGPDAVAAATTLLSNDPKPVAVIGDTCSVSSAAVVDMYQAAGIPLISGSSSASDLTTPPHSFFFRVINRNDAAARELARHFRHFLGLTKVGVIQQPYSLAIQSTDAFIAAFQAMGGTAVGPWTLVSNADFPAAVNDMVAQGVQAIFYADANAPDAGALSAIAAGAGIQVFGWDTIESSIAGYAEAAGAAVTGDWAGTSSRQVDQMPGYVAVHNAYVAQGFPVQGDDVSNLGIFTYDATRMLFDAISRSGTTDPAAARDALAATHNYHGAAGFYIGFDANGDVIPQWSTLARFADSTPAAINPSYLMVPMVTRG